MNRSQTYRRSYLDKIFLGIEASEEAERNNLREEGLDLGRGDSGELLEGMSHDGRVAGTL